MEVNKITDNFQLPKEEHEYDIKTIGNQVLSGENDEKLEDFLKYESKEVESDILKKDVSSTENKIDHDLFASELNRDKIDSVPVEQVSEYQNHQKYFSENDTPDDLEDFLAFEKHHIGIPSSQQIDSLNENQSYTENKNLLIDSVKNDKFEPEITCNIESDFDALENDSSVKVFKSSVRDDLMFTSETQNIHNEPTQPSDFEETEKPEKVLNSVTSETSVVDESSVQKESIKKTTIVEPKNDNFNNSVHERSSVLPSEQLDVTPSNLTLNKQQESTNCKEKSREIGPKELFSKYGLDKWFNPECLNPTVEAYIYWRDPKLSGIIFASGLVLLLSLAYFSFISVIANIGLAILTCAIVFRIYKDILQAVQKTPQTHPYSVFLNKDIQLPREKVSELVDVVILHINACLAELRRLFLVEDMIESLKFALVLWVLTYVGSWFNGLTLVIIGFVSLFTLPKIYENNKVQIDQNLALVRVKLEELTTKIRDALPAPLRRKLPEKQE